MSSYDAGVLAEVPLVAQTPRPTRPMFPEGGFLILAPTLSSDYPSEAISRASSTGSTTAAPPTLSVAALPSTSAIDDSVPDDAAQSVKKDRRSSSISSTGGFRRRVLKLGPVHNGEVTVSDYVEADEE
ncbi:hypothetical protein Vi05172_g7213 [Venturia inaequalis]|nr:hypothetical protein Vi05172_g7213 [Venturia inaequalis]